MEIKEFFKEEKAARAHWTEEIQKSDWRAAGFLAELLTKGTFKDTFGEGELYMLTDGDRLAAFVSFAQRDCLKNESRSPWAGFVYTFPEHRGHRYSELLIGKCAEAAKLKGHDILYICTDHVGLYEKYGFTFLENGVDWWGGEQRILQKRI